MHANTASCLGESVLLRRNSRLKIENFNDFKRYDFLPVTTGKYTDDCIRISLLHFLDEVEQDLHEPPMLMAVLGTDIGGGIDGLENVRRAGDLMGRI